MVRRNCFFLVLFGSMDACYLAEPWECPCDKNCEWFITELQARELVYEKMMAEKEKDNGWLPTH